MKEKNLSNYIKRLLILVVGLTIAHLGVTLFLLSNLGSDPFNVLIQGIAHLLPLSHGTCHQIICFLLLGILLFTARRLINGFALCLSDPWLLYSSLRHDHRNQIRCRNRP